MQSPSSRPPTAGHPFELMVWVSVPPLALLVEMYATPEVADLLVATAMPYSIHCFPAAVGLEAVP